MRFMRNEEAAGRAVTADWAWILPPMSASALSVFHQEFDNRLVRPNFFLAEDAWSQSPLILACPSRDAE